MTRIYVINIPSSEMRRGNIEKQLKSINLNYEFFDAIDGRKQKEHPLFSRYNEEYNEKSLGRTLSYGQLGCFASHYLLWQKCRKLNESIIILEDDALFDIEIFNEFYKESTSLSDNYECVRLFENKKRKYKADKIKNFKNFSIANFSVGHRSATGYFLTPSGAKKLLGNCDKWKVPVDIYMDQAWIHNVECLGTIPACLTNDPRFDSDIGYEKENKSLSMIFKRELFNLKQLINRTIYNIMKNERK
ncbi:glycosyltransferase family 25 protein [Photobacterium leiognathi]|uniref:Epitope biosynthesis protein n=1 Tax=Photobacterium leiognathi subsp. mandapamensis TaxID=48408 RepID=A0A2T3KXX2_PHOLD|nr:glycosyltransferase family 25 protein [Photobacterium leiognathi]PSV12476.1 epitope biosynthesis protein [Photobacterium leiognathi subsp. mandapamensis]